VSCEKIPGWYMGVVFAVVGFLLWANFLPPLANLILGNRSDYPLDGGKTWLDGRWIFGPHKTVRGVVASVLGGAAASPVFGLPWRVAGTAALFAMSGDLLTSFIKRRLDHPSGDPIPVLDQALEALLPTLYLGYSLSLSWWQGWLVVSLFVPITYLGSRFWSYVVERPPVGNYPRMVRSRVRLREWRACHPPLARWHHLINFENFVYYRVVMSWAFRAVGLYEQGVQNALRMRLTQETFWFPDLPASFDGFRILLMTDLHLDGVEGLTDAVIGKVGDVEVDLCLLGGDIRMEMYGPVAPALRELRRLLAHVRTRHGILGVLGNHDCIEMVPEFEDAGVWMLINESQEIRVNGESLWVVGVDDPHFYKTHDLELAFRSVPEQSFRLFLAHSPEAWREAAEYRSHFYLCGHTHGGQICLPGWGPMFTHSKAPRHTAAGRWEYQGMVGYTSRGVGASGIPLRFNCPGEIALITLRRGATAPG
jgi:uncharacterized protein